MSVIERLLAFLGKYKVTEPLKEEFNSYGVW